MSVWWYPYRIHICPLMAKSHQCRSDGVNIVCQLNGSHVVYGGNVVSMAARWSPRRIKVTSMVVMLHRCTPNGGLSVYQSNILNTCTLLLKPDIILCFGSMRLHWTHVDCHSSLSIRRITKRPVSYINNSKLVSLLCYISDQHKHVLCYILDPTIAKIHLSHKSASEKCQVSMRQMLSGKNYALPIAPCMYS